MWEQKTVGRGAPMSQDPSHQVSPLQLPHSAQDWAPRQLLSLVPPRLNSAQQRLKPVPQCRLMLGRRCRVCPEYCPQPPQGYFALAPPLPSPVAEPFPKGYHRCPSVLMPGRCQQLQAVLRHRRQQQGPFAPRSFRSESTKMLRTPCC